MEGWDEMAEEAVDGGAAHAGSQTNHLPQAPPHRDACSTQRHTTGWRPGIRIF